MPEKNILLIGCGPHARTFYFPTFEKIGKETGCRLVAAVDLESNRGAVETLLGARYPGCEFHYVGPSGETLSTSTVELLDRIVEDKQIDGVVVSTDPLNHKSYALWALSRNLHLLLDKPITTRVDAAIELWQAEAIEADFRDVITAYEDAYRKKKTIFSVCTHRRYHPGIDAALEIVGDVAQKTSCPITNIHAYHCDGQWRLPGEMITQSHHSYFDGHGKVSHSGYHFIDGVCRVWRAGLRSGKSAETVEVFSSFVRPRGLIRQLASSDYVRIFGNEYTEINSIPDDELSKRFEGFGEIDAEVNATFLSDGEPIALATLSLLHNGFSRRSDVRPGVDLYKGNGRVKHEQHRIHVGPFVCVQIHSYQSKDKHDQCDFGDLDVGGNNHFEMLVFRNTGVIGGKSVECFRLSDLTRDAGFGDSVLHIQRIKEGAVREFADFLNGKTTRDELRSDIADHFMSVRLMSGIYRAWCLRQSGGDPIVRLEWK